ncbi:MAG: YbaN family protein [Defluviitaleaceae bacterium]|nr:YbaN family protein [Defluviitaleaceae bacterium]
MKGFKKILFNILGMICLVIGIINRFIPGLPTTPLLILASMLFAQANPKMQAWLLKSKFLGPYLDNYYNKRGMAMAYKIRTVAFMWSGMLFSMTLIPLLWVKILMAVIGLIVSFHIFMAKTLKTDIQQYGFFYNIFSILICWIWFGLGLFLADSLFDYHFLGIFGGIITISILTYAMLAKGGASDDKN